MDHNIKFQVPNITNGLPKHKHQNQKEGRKCVDISLWSSLVTDLGLEEGVFHSDCSVLVQSVRERRPPEWSNACTFLNVISWFSCNNNFHVCWTPRASNMAAHSLAQWGLKFSSSDFLNFWKVNPHVITSI
ncbi:hypothetical protein G4B88_018885 [Cannabis sativa]|uniref:RNase H type-1 domain-containing protein n=1 Tax=Cannabis sativa TaxID=3483 RepID=A0A7J6E207_CANSA|nr:hypothetical protein G4B88_018885 [Cannabis sativa]